MKVNVTRKGHLISVKGSLVELEIGEQEIDDKAAKSMIKSGFAVEVETKKSKSK